ncbi:MAG: PQQ-binding-like beta-propeller repeat protein [Proteobacteria bacterium]|nr:PQQ-binding-like beta-propeller repeat protein [Pseudomonadota bacterium]
MNRVIKVAALGVACVALASCGTVSKMNPFHGPKSKIVAAKGERIPVLTYDTTVKPSDALSGVEIALPEAQPVAAWPLPGGNAEQSLENVQAAPDFQVAWRRDIGVKSGAKTQVTAPPVAVDGKIFTMDGQADVVATDAKTGRHEWRTNLRPKSKRDKEAFGGGLAVADGKVLVTSGFRLVAALDAATGKVLWQKNVTSPIHAAPTISNGRVFAVDLDDQILAFDVNNGDQVWSYQALVEPARVLKASSPAVLGDEVVAPFASGELVALSAANGNALWDQALSRTSRMNALSEIRDIPGRPVIYKGDVYAASQSGVFAAVDVRSGNPRWELPIASINTPWPAGDAVYIVSKAGEVVAVNRESGQVYWLVDLNKGRTRQEGGFARIGRHVVHPIWSGPMLSGDRLILVNNWGEAVTLEAKTGKLTKTIKIGDASYMSPIAYDGMIYVVTDNAKLVAIR